MQPGVGGDHQKMCGDVSEEDHWLPEFLIQSNHFGSKAHLVRENMSQ